MAKITLKVKVYETHYQYQLIVSKDAAQIKQEVTDDLQFILIWI